MRYFLILLTCFFTSVSTNAKAGNQKIFQFGEWSVAKNDYKDFKNIVLYTTGKVQENDEDITSPPIFDTKPYLNFICKNNTITSFSIIHRPWTYDLRKLKAMDDYFEIPYEVFGQGDFEIKLKYYHKKYSATFRADTNNSKVIETIADTLKAGSSVRFEINKPTSINESVVFNLENFTAAYQKFEMLCSR